MSRIVKCFVCRSVHQYVQDIVLDPGTYTYSPLVYTTAETYVFALWNGSEWEEHSVSARSGWNDFSKGDKITFTISTRCTKFSICAGSVSSAAPVKVLLPMLEEGTNSSTRKPNELDLEEEIETSYLKNPKIINGYWWVWNGTEYVNTGDPSRGEDGAQGLSPQITDGYWYVWDGTAWINTNIKAEGVDGRDGKDIEFIFTRNNTGVIPSTPATSQTDDYVPTGWTDNAQGVTMSLRYEFASLRTKTNGVWSAFSTPALWAKYSVDGQNASHVEFSPATAVVKVLKDGSLDKTQVGTTATAQNASIAYYRYYVDGGSALTSPPSGVTKSGNYFLINLQTLQFSNRFVIAAYNSSNDFLTEYNLLKVAEGQDGVAGINAKLLYLSASAQVMKCNANNTAQSGQTITVEAKLQNVAGTATFTATPYNDAGTALSSIALGGSGNTRTLSSAQWQSNYKSVKITATLGTLTDTVTIHRIADGAEGQSGQNAIVGLLTNENITLQASATGVVSSFATATGEFQVYYGLTKITSGITFSVVQQTGCAVSINSSGAYSVSAMSADNAYAKLRAVYNGVTIDKVLTLSKSKAGQDGQNGSSVHVRYRRSLEKPATPATGDLNPSGWYTTPDHAGDNPLVSNPGVDGCVATNYFGDSQLWTKQSDGYNRAPRLKVNGSANCRLVFETTANNATVNIDIRTVFGASTYLYSGALDANDPTSGYKDFTSTTATKTLSYAVATAGVHFIKFKLLKSGTIDMLATEYAEFALKTTIGRVWRTDCAVVNGVASAWSEPVIYSDNTNQTIMPYPNGVWNKTATYTRTERSAPFVEHGGQVYLLNRQGTFTGDSNPNPQEDYATNGSLATWVLFEHIPYLFTNVLLAEFAKLGSAVFTQNRLISQQGIDGTNNYQSYAGDAGTWQPNIMLDFLTGKGHLSRKNMEWDADGNVKLKGGIRNPFSYAPYGSSIEYFDNVAIRSSSGSWQDVYNLPWDINQSGRRITFVNWKWGSLTANGYADFTAPSGKFFFRDGKASSLLRIWEGDMIELLGYGTQTEFYGWIVARQEHVVTMKTAGGALRVLAVGTVNGNSAGASFGGYKTFDDSTLTVSRQAAGKYRISFPSSWSFATGDPKVMLAGFGYVSGSTTQPVKATLVSRTSSYIDVVTSAGTSAADGSFEFIIMSASYFGF